MFGSWCGQWEDGLGAKWVKGKQENWVRSRETCQAAVWNTIDPQRTRRRSYAGYDQVVHPRDPQKGPSVAGHGAKEVHRSVMVTATCISRKPCGSCTSHVPSPPCLQKEGRQLKWDVKRHDDQSTREGCQL